jgi:hypothetical protein
MLSGCEIGKLITWPGQSAEEVKMKRNLVRIAGLLIALAWANLAASQEERPKQPAAAKLPTPVKTVLDCQYLEHGHERNRLDLYLVVVKGRPAGNAEVQPAKKPYVAITISKETTKSANDAARPAAEEERGKEVHSEQQTQAMKRPWSEKEFPVLAGWPPMRNLWRCWSRPRSVRGVTIHSSPGMAPSSRFCCRPWASTGKLRGP